MRARLGALALTLGPGLAACGGDAGSPGGGGPGEGLAPIAASAGEACEEGVRACADGLYCARPNGACLDDPAGPGTCEAIQPMCTMDYRPVCGCDDSTYSNACAANAKGVNVASEGTCRD